VMAPAGTCGMLRRFHDDCRDLQVDTPNDPLSWNREIVHNIMHAVMHHTSLVALNSSIRMECGAHS
jgi:hypothetical protein